MRNALTFDVEEYFQVEAFKSFVTPADWPRYPSRVVASTQRILDLLEARGVAATFFVLGCVAERHPDLVREIGARGHELACHSYAHQAISSLGREAFREDLRRGKQAIEQVAGVAVIGYRAPTFSIVHDTRWALDAIAEEGFQYDSSIFPIRHDRYGIPEAPRFPHRLRLTNGGDLIEFPMSTVRVMGQSLPFSGGGYFRLLPYPVVRRGIRRVNRHDRMPAMVYLHPWEFDAEQPRMPVGLATRFRHYVNIGQTLAKLSRLLDDFEFAPAADVLRTHCLLEVVR